MTILFLALIIIASVAIGLFILIQNPKGGGLSGNIGGFNTQFMGVKQTTDVLEKGTWVMAIAIALLCLFSAFFIPKQGGSSRDSINAKPQQSAPAPTPGGNPLQTTPAPAK
jgi:preprotein translocase subunit SecG